VSEVSPPARTSDSASPRPAPRFSFGARLPSRSSTRRPGYLYDDITLPLLWLGLLLNLGGTYVPIGDAVVGAAAGYLSLWTVYQAFKLLTGRKGMGFGDFKLNAAVGAFLGWKMLPLVILVSSVVGSIFGIGQMFAAKRGWEWNFKFHFGPYLAIAGIVAMFWGRQIVDWYLR